MNTNNGWKLVPERATKAMQDAWDTGPFSEDTDAEFHGAYAAMIAAAPASAQPERDWELTCEDCDGDGFVYVERRVGMCVTDVQTFKEDCECCEGRGFTIAFEDIPGIAEYVKSCCPASTVADEGAKDWRGAFDVWYDRRGVWPRLTYEEIFSAGWHARPAPAAGDARDAARYRWLRDPKSDPALVLDKRTGYVPVDETIPGVGGYHTYEYRAGEELDAAIDAAISASQQGGE